MSKNPIYELEQKNLSKKEKKQSEKEKEKSVIEEKKYFENVAKFENERKKEDNAIFKNLAGGPSVKRMNKDKKIKELENTIITKAKLDEEKKLSQKEIDKKVKEEEKKKPKYDFSQTDKKVAEKNKAIKLKSKIKIKFNQINQKRTENKNKLDIIREFDELNSNITSLKKRLIIFFNKFNRDTNSFRIHRKEELKKINQKWGFNTVFNKVMLGTKSANLSILLQNKDFFEKNIYADVDVNRHINPEANYKNYYIKAKLFLINRLPQINKQKLNKSKNTKYVNLDNLVNWKERKELSLNKIDSYKVINGASHDRNKEAANEKLGFIKSGLVARNYLDPNLDTWRDNYTSSDLAKSNLKKERNAAQTFSNELEKIQKKRKFRYISFSSKASTIYLGDYENFEDYISSNVLAKPSKKIDFFKNGVSRKSKKRKS